MITVALIAAVGRNGVIGDGGHIPWRLPSDFAWFKRQTMGKPLIMGRKTYESIGKALPGRTNIVVTRQDGFHAEGVVVVASVEEALALGKERASADGAQEVMVGGGGQIYREAMPFADRLYITHVEATPDGDVTFPAIAGNEWIDSGSIDVERTPRDSAAFRVTVYSRRRPGSH